VSDLCKAYDWPTKAPGGGLRLDVSILSHPRPIPAASESELAGALEPDRDGLILSAGRRRALFLPSVWRHLPDARVSVRHLTAKGGFESNRWPEGLEARRLRADSFGAPWRQIDSKELASPRSTRRRSNIEA
jgi:AMMECR1